MKYTRLAAFITITMAPLFADGDFDPPDNYASPGQSPEELPNRQEFSAELQIDSETVLSLLADVRKYRDEASDTAAQRKIKRSRIRKRLKSLNKGLDETSVNFLAARVVNVEKAIYLTKAGQTAYTKWLQRLSDHADSLYADVSAEQSRFHRILLREFRRQNAHFCRECFHEGKTYEIEYEIADEISGSAGILTEGAARIQTVILKTVKDEDEVLKSKVGSFQDITGKLTTIFYSGQYPEVIVFHLEPE